MRAMRGLTEGRAGSHWDEQVTIGTRNRAVQPEALRGQRRYHCVVSHWQDGESTALEGSRPV